MDYKQYITSLYNQLNRKRDLIAKDYKDMPTSMLMCLQEEKTEWHRKRLENALYRYMLTLN